MYSDPEIAKAYKREWRRKAMARDCKTRTTNLKWQAIYKELKRKDRLWVKSNPPWCIKHKIPLSFVVCKGWICGLCSKEKERRNESSRRMKKTYDRMVIRYGLEIANLYLESRPIVQAQETTFKVLFNEIIKRHIQQKHGYTPDKEKLKRIYTINRVAQLPLANHTWTCSHCGLQDSNPWFFDLDHIQPRSHGGRDTYDNMRVLCPNCHRKRHINESSFPTIAHKETDTVFSNDTLS